MYIIIVKSKMNAKHFQNNNNNIENGR